MRFPERGLYVSWSFWLLILLAAIVSPLTIVLSARLARCCTRAERKGSLTGVSLSLRSRAAA